MTRYEKQIIMNALEHYAKNAETEKERRETEVMCIVWKDVLDQKCGTVKI